MDRRQLLIKLLVKELLSTPADVQPKIAQRHKRDCSKAEFDRYIGPDPTNETLAARRRLRRAAFAFRPLA